MAGMGQHNVRVGDDLWRAAMARAKAEGVTVTDVIIRALAEYAGPAGPMGIRVVADDAIPPGTAMLMSPGSGPQFMTGISAVPGDPVTVAPPAVSGSPVRSLAEPLKASLAAAGAAARSRAARKPEPPPDLPLAASERCTHPGTRMIGGWCAPCGRQVREGGW